METHPNLDLGPMRMCDAERVRFKAGNKCVRRSRACQLPQGCEMRWLAAVLQVDGDLMMT